MENVGVDGYCAIMTNLSLSYLFVAVESETITDQVRNLTDHFWEWRLLESPEYGSRVGIHDNDHLVEEYTEEAFLRQKVRPSSIHLHAIKVKRYRSDA